LSLEDREIEFAEPLRGTDYLDARDFPAGPGETENAGEMAERRQDNADVSIDEGWLCRAHGSRKGDGAFGPIARAVDLDGRAGSSRTRVHPRHNIGVEHGDQCFHISGAQGGEEGIDDLALLRED
jgi:hypothetical protein